MGLVVVVVWWRWEVEAGERGRGVSQKDRQRKEVLGELEREERERETERVEQEEAEPDGMISGSRIRGEEEGPDKSKSGVNRPWRGKNGGEGEGEGFAIVGRGTFGKVGTWEGRRSGHRKKKM